MIGLATTRPFLLGVYGSMTFAHNAAGFPIRADRESLFHVLNIVRDGAFADGYDTVKLFTGGGEGAHRIAKDWARFWSYPRFTYARSKRYKTPLKPFGMAQKIIRNGIDALLIVRPESDEQAIRTMCATHSVTLLDYDDFASLEIME